MPLKLYIYDFFGKFDFTKNEYIAIIFSFYRYDGVKEIAAKAPKLTFVKGERAEIRQLNINHAISKDGVTYAELQEFKTNFLKMFDHDANLYNQLYSITKAYPFGMVIYLLSVYWLEYLRLQMCCDVSTFNKLFDYLEDKALQNDKSNVYGK